MAFYELRRYEVRPGKMDEWIALMEREIVPFQIAAGMVITGLFRGETDDGVFVWMRRFESEEDRVRLYADVYESARWQEEILPQVTELIFRETISVTRLTPTTVSPQH